jgi:hypothetical protein
MGKEVESHSASIVDGADYIGYTAKFTEAPPRDSPATIVTGMNGLSMGPVRTHPRKQISPFTPYSTTPKRSISAKEETIHSAPTRQPKSKHLEGSNSSERPQAPWAKLVSKTDNGPDISLFMESTAIGKFVDHVDIDTGERETDYSMSHSHVLTNELRLSYLSYQRWSSRNSWCSACHHRG